MNPYNPINIATSVEQIKRYHKLKCSQNLPQEKNKKRAQCALLNMKSPSKLTYGRTIGKGVQGEVRAFSMELDPEGEDIKNEYIRDSVDNINNSVIKSGIEKKDQSELRTEAFIGLYLDLISDYTPNFSYSHDIRRLNPLPVENQRSMLGSQQNVLDAEREYGIITEFAGGRILKGISRIPQNQEIIKQILLQLLFSLYIAVKEIGFVHFDLHTGNILINETNPVAITYQVPISPETFIEVYRTSEIYRNDRKFWDGKMDLKRNVWILEETDLKDDDIVNNRTPVNLLLQNRPHTSLRIDRIKRDDGKYEQKFHYFPINVGTKVVPKIIDYGFSSVYFGNQFVVNPIARDLVFNYGGLTENLPNKPYLCIDMWKILYYLFYTWNNGNPDLILKEPILIEIFGQRYMTYLRNKLSSLINMGVDPNQAIQFHIGQFKYLENTEVVEQNILPEYIKDNELFMNKCMVVINDISKLMPVAPTIQPVPSGLPQPIPTQPLQIIPAYYGMPQRPPVGSQYAQPVRSGIPLRPSYYPPQFYAAPSISRFMPPQPMPASLSRFMPPAPIPVYTYSGLPTRAPMNNENNQR
jgi:hypothetical protein